MYIFLLFNFDSFNNYLGRLAGEKNYNKRVYLYAKIVKEKSRGTKKKKPVSFELNIRTDEIFHDLGW